MHCPFCNSSEIESGFLFGKVDTGVLNFLHGFSVGTEAKIYWSDRKNGFPAKPIGFDNPFPAWKCHKCDAILFSPEIGKPRIVFFSNWIKFFTITAVALILFLVFALSR